MSKPRPQLRLVSLVFPVLVSGTVLAQNAQPRTAVPAPPGTNVRNPPMTQVASNTAAAPTKIYAIEGATSVPVRAANGSIRRVQTGDALADGDVVFAEDNTYVDVQLPDGSRVRVGQRTQLEVGRDLSGAGSVNLHAGALRGTTAEHLKDKGDEIRAKLRENLKGKHRMYVRTKSAVLGVRGTDFVVSYDANTSVSEFRTLQGTVEIGQSMDGLSAGRLMRVTENRFVKADGNNIYKPQAFESGSYIQNLRKIQPGLVRGDDGSSGGEDNAVFQWKRLRLAGVYAYNDTGDTMTGRLSYNPWLRLGQRLGVGLGVGGSMYLGSDASTKFIVADAGPYVTYRLFKSWEIEAGGGVEMWLDKDNYLMYGGSVSWIARRGWIPLLERVVFSYRGVTTNEPTKTIMAGIGISL